MELGFNCSKVEGIINREKQTSLFSGVAVLLGVGEYVPVYVVREMFGGAVWNKVFDLSRNDKSLAYYVSGAGFMVTPKGFNMAVTIHNQQCLEHYEKLWLDKLDSE